MAVKLLVAVICFLFTTLVFFWATNNAQKDVYMDEVFHVPQAQQYCRGNFTSWDPMITTLPGLYLASLPLLYPVTLTLRKELSSVCTVFILRSINIIFSLANLYLLYLIAHKLHFNRKNATKVILTALALATFPVLYFFTFLYYTDPAAVFFALLTYYLAVLHRHKSAAAVGVFAIVCRQTNVVWVVFSTGLTVGRVLTQWIQKKKGERRKVLLDWSALPDVISVLGHSLRQNPKEFANLMVQILKEVWCYGSVGVGFIAFIIFNEGIVVGDRSNHQPCMNFPQLFYFLFVTTFFACLEMISLNQVKEFVRYSVTKPIKTLLFFLVAAVFIAKFTFIHEYNLADNRHYNFYFLSKLIRRNQFSKFILIPAYYYAFVTFWALLQNKDVFWKLSYLICTCATVIPQRMVEFRYFILPYLIFRLNMPMPCKFLLAGEVLFYFVVNAFTVYMYIYRPFPWANDDSLQRFMW